MGNIYKDGKLLKSRARPRINPVDFDSLKSRIDRASSNKNDLLEAEDFSMIAMVVSNDNRHPATDEVLPIPEYLRHFISNVFSDISLGVDPANALLMKPHGSRKKYLIGDKFLVCDMVNQLVEQNVKVGDAYKEVAAVINNRFCNLKTDEQKKEAFLSSPAWHSFFGSKLAWTTVRDWYQKYDPIAAGARLADKK